MWDEKYPHKLLNHLQCRILLPVSYIDVIMRILFLHRCLPGEFSYTEVRGNVFDIKSVQHSFIWSIRRIQATLNSKIGELPFVSCFPKHIVTV